MFHIEYNPIHLNTQYKELHFMPNYLTEGVVITYVIYNIYARKHSSNQYCKMLHHAIPNSPTTLERKLSNYVS